MSKNGKRAAIIGSHVQLVCGDVVRAAVVTRVHSPSIVNLKAVLDADRPDTWHVSVQSEDEAARANEANVGFRVEQFWRWPRAD